MSSNKKYGNITIKSLKYGNISSHMVMLPYNINTYHKLVYWFMVINLNIVSYKIGNITILHNYLP